MYHVLYQDTLYHCKSGTNRVVNTSLKSVLSHWFDQAAVKETRSSRKTRNSQPADSISLLGDWLCAKMRGDS